MREQGHGTINGVSSGLGVRSVPLQVPYCVAKHGLVALYEGLRLEEQHAQSGVQVTTILPGSINTPLFDVAPSWMLPALRLDQARRRATRPLQAR